MNRTDFISFWSKTMPNLINVTILYSKMLTISEVNETLFELK